MTVPPTNPTSADPFSGREIWFVTGSQHLYGPETLEEVAARMDALLPAHFVASEVTLMEEYEPDRCRARETFALGAQ